jgi:hypothetical protein
MIRRWGFNIASLASLLFAIATIVFWIRSHWRDDQFYWTRVSNHGTSGSTVNYALVSDEGIVGVAYVRVSTASSDPAGLHWDSLEAGGLTPKTTLERLGFMHDHERVIGPGGMSFTESVYAVPAWLVVIAFLIPPIAWLRRFLKRPKSSNACRKCGYNLTGNASGVCPECGTPVPSKPEAIA